MVHMSPELWEKDDNSTSCRDIPRGQHTDFSWGCVAASASCEEGVQRWARPALPWTFPCGSAVTAEGLLCRGLWPQARLWRSCSVFGTETRKWASERTSQEALLWQQPSLTADDPKHEGGISAFYSHIFGGTRDLILTALVCRAPHLLGMNDVPGSAILTLACLRGLERFSGLFFIYLFIYLKFIYIYGCVGWVFVSVRGLSLVAASGGHSSSRCAGVSPSRPLLLRCTGSRRAGSVVVAHGPSYSAACGIFPDQGSNPCPLHWQADSQPLRHQGSPQAYFLNLLFF